MPIAPAEDEPPKKEPSFKELAEFVIWADDFLEWLFSAPTAQETS